MLAVLINLDKTLGRSSHSGVQEPRSQENGMQYNQWPCKRNRLIGGTYHIVRPMFLGYVFAGISPQFIWPKIWHSGLRFTYLHWIGSWRSPIDTMPILSKSGVLQSWRCPWPKIRSIPQVTASSTHLRKISRTTTKTNHKKRQTLKKVAHLKP